MAGVSSWESMLPPLPGPPEPPPEYQMEGEESNSKPIPNETAEALPAGIKEFKSVLLGCLYLDAYIECSISNYIYIDIYIYI